MNNPFKAGDIVTTKIKGQQVEAKVNQVYNQEVQVRTTDNKLLWRPVKTVTLLRAAPEPTPQAGATVAAISAEKGSPPAAEEPEAPPLLDSPALEPESPEAKREGKVKSGPSLTYPRTRSRNRKPPKI